MTTLLTYANAKTSKGEALGYLTAILYMAPADSVDDGFNLCPAATPGCKASCLFTAGRGAFSNVKAARERKRAEYVSDPDRFISNIHDELKSARKKAARLGLKLCVRLNGTTDIAWEYLRLNARGDNIFSANPDLQFYDYTKRADRAMKFAHGKMVPNYHLTFSKSESNGIVCTKLQAEGVNIAAVFGNKELAQSAASIDGDLHDLRFLDGTTQDRGNIIGLSAKGRAKKDTTGFVQR